MKTIQINTTQNVPINFEIADVGRRLLAFIIDNVLKLTYLYFAFKFFDLSDLERTFSDGWSIRALWVILWFPVMLYTIISEILMNGQTLGKIVMKIRVVNIDGFKPSTADYIMRWFLRVVDFNFYILLFIYASSLGILNSLEIAVGLFFVFGKTIGLVCILVTKNNQRLGDMAANTIVISLIDKAKFSNTIIENISDVYEPKFPNVISLSDNDMRIIKDNYTSAIKRNDYKTLAQICKKIKDVTSIDSENMTDKEFINIILKDYNYYTQNM